MIDIFPAVRDLLLNNYEIHSVVSDRIYIGRLELNSELPAISLDDAGIIVDHSDLPCQQIKISCWAGGESAFKTAYQLRECVISNLFNYQGTSLGVRILKTIMGSSVKVIEDDTGIHQFVIFINFKYIK